MNRSYWIEEIVSRFVIDWGKVLLTKIEKNSKLLKSSLEKNIYIQLNSWSLEYIKGIINYWIEEIISKLSLLTKIEKNKKKIRKKSEKNKKKNKKKSRV